MTKKVSSGSHFGIISLLSGIIGALQQKFLDWRAE